MRPAVWLAVGVNTVAAGAAVVPQVAQPLQYLHLAEAQPAHDLADGPRRAFVAVQLVRTFNQLAPRIVGFGQPVAVGTQDAAALGQERQVFGGDQIDQARHQLRQLGQIQTQTQFG